MKADPDAAVAPPQTVERGDDELARLGVVNLHQPTTILHTQTSPSW